MTDGAEPFFSGAEAELILLAADEVIYQKALDAVKQGTARERFAAYKALHDAIVAAGYARAASEGEPEVSEPGE